jgi:hypothetical protein
LAKDVSLLIDEKEKERTVLDDRSADANSKLVPVFVVFRGAVEIIEPVACDQGGIAVRPESAPPNLIGSGAGHHLHLPGSAARLRHRRAQVMTRTSSTRSGLVNVAVNAPKL